MDWQIVRYKEVSLCRGPFHIFYQHWGKEHRSLYRYIEVPLYMQKKTSVGRNLVDKFY